MFLLICFLYYFDKVQIMIIGLKYDWKGLIFPLVNKMRNMQVLTLKICFENNANAHD